MTDSRSDRVIPIVLSVLIHAAIVGALVWGWWFYRSPPPAPQTLAIEATVVGRAAPTLPNPPAQSQPTPPAPPPPSTPPPDTQAQQAAAQKALEQAAQQRAAEQQAVQQKVHEQAERAAQEKAQADKQAELQRQADAQRQAQADAARKVKEDADRKAKEDADRKAKADADRKAQELAQQRQSEQDRADLRSQLEAEEHENAVQSGPAKAEYLSLITARINHAWIRPPSARAGVRCTVHLTQIPGGEITHVSVTGCNGDESVRQSVETAAYRASPLPAPSDPALFDPNLDVTFAPDE